MSFYKGPLYTKKSQWSAKVSSASITSELLMQALTQPTRRKEAANRPEPDPSPVRYFRLVLIHKLAQAPSNTSLRRGHRGSLADRESLAIHRPRKGPDPSPARQRGPRRRRLRIHWQQCRLLQHGAQVAAQERHEGPWHASSQLFKPA